MRWDHLRTEAEQERRLPGYREPATVRTFDAPEALDIRFYEVRAKSVLNRVPNASRMPFRWTVNPYRGCSHACVYCLEGATPILMADARTKPLRDVRPGEQLYGTRRIGRHRRCVRSRVLAHWSTVKPAYRVILADGTELVASGDHRFLTTGGWKHVSAAQRGHPCRPHLTPDDKLIGTGAFAPAPEADIATEQLAFSAAGAGHWPMTAIGTQSRDRVEAVREMIAWPRWPHADGDAPRCDARLEVVDIEPLGVELPMFDITTETGDFIANGVVSHNCFARPTHTYLDFDAGRDFEREIVVKVNAPEVLRAQLSRPSWTKEHVAMGTNTDPYQWVEARYRLMPGIWEALRDTGTPCSVLTKSPLLVRDLDLLVDVARHVPVSANFSVPTLEEKAWRATEPHTPHPRARLEAVAKLNQAGIPTGILIAPLMPGINDSPEQVQAIVDQATEAGATGIGGIALHLRGEVRGIFFEWLGEHRPDLLERYEELYRRGAYASSQERRRLAALVSAQGATPPSRLRRAIRESQARTGLRVPGETDAGGAESAPQQTLF